MHIIPVIDLLNGVVVHAKQGQRHQYQPIQSALTASAKPLDIVKAFSDIYPFKTLYIADLNAIQRLPDANQHHTIIATILDTFPELTIWIDAGIQNVSDTQYWQQVRIKPVIGTENMRHMDDYVAIQQTLVDDFVLSLDFMPNGYQGPNPLVQDQQTWPQAVIAMTLKQVGTQSGVDITILHQIIKQAHQQHIYAAGGVRNLLDLMQLRDMQVYGALVASALHSKQINRADLDLLYSTDKKTPG